MGNLICATYVMILINVTVSWNLRVYTPKDHTFSYPLARRGFNIKNRTSLKFKFKGCSDCHVFIQEKAIPDLSTAGNWAFIIGGWINSRNAISSSVRVHDIHGYHYEAVLNCNEYRQFWISWSGGLLQSGKGDEILKNIMSARQISTPKQFNYAFLLTGFDSDGCWIIDTENSQLTSTWTKITGKKIQDSRVLRFNVKSKIMCSVICGTPSPELPCGCEEYSYNKVTRECLVVDARGSVSLVDDNDWETRQLV